MLFQTPWSLLCMDAFSHHLLQGEVRRGGGSERGRRCHNKICSPCKANKEEEKVLHMVSLCSLCGPGQTLTHCLKLISSQGWSPKVPAGERTDIPDGLLVFLRRGRKVVKEGIYSSLWKLPEHRAGCGMLWGVPGRNFRPMSSTTALCCNLQSSNPDWRSCRSSLAGALEETTKKNKNLACSYIHKCENPYNKTLPFQPLSGPLSPVGDASLT